MTNLREFQASCSVLYFFPHLYYILSPHLHTIFLVKQFVNACDLIAGIYVAEVNLDLKLRHY